MVTAHWDPQNTDVFQNNAINIAAVRVLRSLKADGAVSAKSICTRSAAFCIPRGPVSGERCRKGPPNGGELPPAKFTI